MSTIINPDSPLSELRPWTEVRAHFLKILQHLEACPKCSHDCRHFVDVRQFTQEQYDCNLFKPTTDEIPTRHGVWWNWHTLAPEYAALPGFHGSPQADMFSLGTLLHQSLTGQWPWPDLTDCTAFFQRWHCLSESSPPPLNQAIFNLLAGSDTLLRAWLHPHPHCRTKTWMLALKELQSCHWRPLAASSGAEYEAEMQVASSLLAEVFQGTRLNDGKKVAMKIATGRNAERIRREVVALDLCRHLPVPQLLDHITMPGLSNAEETTSPCIAVLDWLDGLPRDTLRGRLRNAPNGLPWAEAIALFVVYLEALSGMHTLAEPMLHGDIKPSNLYAPQAQPRRARLLDLGSAMTFDQARTTPPSGSPDYLPPEAAAGDPQREPAQTDIFALGCCMFEALNGTRAYPRLPASPQQARRIRAAQIAKALPTAARDLFSQSLPKLATVINRAIDLDPKRRYRTIAEFQAAFHQALQA